MTGRPRRWGHVGSRLSLRPSSRGLHSEPGLAPCLPAEVCSDGPHLAGGRQTAEGPRHGRVQACGQQCHGPGASPPGCQQRRRAPAVAGPRAVVPSAASAPLPRNSGRVTWALWHLGSRQLNRGPSRPRHHRHGGGAFCGQHPELLPSTYTPFYLYYKKTLIEENWDRTENDKEENDYVLHALIFQRECRQCAGGQPSTFVSVQRCM